MKVTKKKRILFSVEMVINSFTMPKPNVDSTMKKTKKQSRKQSNKICTRGENFVFKKRCTCFYYHEDVRVQGRTVKTYNRKSEIYCKFQESCSKSYCKFKHFESNFPQKPAPKKKKLRYQIKKSK